MLNIYKIYGFLDHFYVNYFYECGYPISYNYKFKFIELNNILKNTKILTL